MFTRSVLDTKRTDERSGNVLELVERRLHRDLQLCCGLRSLKCSNADVRARLCGCRGGIVEWKRANVRTRNVSNAKRCTDERQRTGDDGYEQARLCCDVHVQQRLRPLVRKPSHVRAERRDFIRCMERLGADVRDCDVQRTCGSKSWKRSDAIQHEQPRLDRNVCMRRYILSVLQHHSDVCTDGSLSGRDLVWRSADVQQSPVSCAGAANEWWGDCVLFKSRCGLDSNLYVRCAIHAVFRSGTHVQSDGSERCWYVERF